MQIPYIDLFWKELVKIIQDRHDINFSISNSNNIFLIF